MYTDTRLLLIAAVSTLILGGCATRYDSRVVDQRTQELFGESTPPLLRDAPQAEDDSTEGVFTSAELTTYVDFALRHNAELRGAFQSWRASTERVAQVSTLPDPRLSFGEFLEEVQTRTGPQRRRFGLSQAFPWPGKLDAQAKHATLRAEAAWERVEVVRLKVAREVEEAFHEYAYLGRELAITKELLELVKALEPVVQGRIRAGAGQEDLLRLQVEIGRLEDDLASIERRRPSLSARLSDAMNLPMAASAPLPLPGLDVPEGKPLDTAELVRVALNESPALRALEQELATARAAEDVAAFKRRPEFAARFDYIDTGDAINSGTPGSGDDPLFLGLSLSLPVWTASYSAAEREARHLSRAARAKLVDATSSLSAHVTEEAYRVDDALRRVRLYRESLLPRAREALQLTTVSYRSGSASVLDLLDSERALLEFELSLWRACREYLQGEARLRELIGGSIQ